MFCHGCVINSCFDDCDRTSNDVVCFDNYATSAVIIEPLNQFIKGLSEVTLIKGCHGWHSKEASDWV
jgi:hypothetical protein